MRWLLALCFALPSAAAADDWAPADKWLLGGAIGVLAVDWAQTRDLAQRPAYYEKNAMLPSHPNTGDVDKYFIGAMLATAGVAYVLPAMQRRYFLGAVVVLETAIVVKNHQIGLRLAF